MVLKTDLIVTSSFYSLPMNETSKEFTPNALDSLFAVQTSNPPTAWDVESDLISEEVIQYVYTINFSVVCAVFCVFGIVTNTINVVIFCRQGFKETVNIALMALSLSDLCSLVSLLWVSICFNPFFMYSRHVPFVTLDVQHISGGWTHIIFTRITAFITSYVTLERCLCIASPLKVKRILTPKRVTAIIFSIYFIILATMCPGYYSDQLGWKFYPSINRTLLGIVFAENKYLIHSMIYYLNFVYPIVSFIAVVTCSAILIWKLNERGKWLQSTSAGGKEKTKTSRDQQVVRMIIWVAGIFISTFTPSLLFFLVISVERQVNMSGTHQNLFLLLCSLVYLLDAINSSMNIFIYYNMSSNYKRIFRSMFRLNSDQKT